MSYTAGQLQSWDTAIDRLLSGQRLSTADAARVRAALDAWPGIYSSLLGAYVGKGAVRNAVDRNAKGELPKASQVDNIRKLQAWVRLEYSQAFAPSEGRSIQTQETYIPPVEQSFPNTPRKIEQFLASLSPPPVQGSQRWINARGMLSRSDYYLLRANETLQAKKLAQRQATARIHFAAQNLVRQAAVHVSGGGAIIDAADQAISEAIKHNEAQYAAMLDAQGDEPYSYGLAVHYRLAWPVAVQYARGRLTDNRSWVRDRAQGYLASLGQAAGTVSHTPPPRLPYPSPSPAQASSAAPVVGGGLLFLLLMALV